VAATVSIGLVFSEAAALDVPELLAQADRALYFAKAHGRNRVEIATLDMVLARRDGEPDTQGVQRIVKTQSAA
jgi:predicted signal transduction protein with EAL and GGDEF domain